MTSVVVADASPFVRLGVSSALRDAGLDVVAEAATAEAAQAAILVHRPDAALLDVELDRDFKISAGICRLHPELALVFLCPDAGDAAVLAAVRAGARGVLSKETPLERLPTIVRGAVAGEAVLSRTQARSLMDLLMRQSPAERLARDSLRISARERQVLELMSAGLSDDAIAARLGLSPVTVRRHAGTARHKLRAVRREDALQRFRDAVA
jgi:DNA-binding NarL/FixJ family response regulator